MKNEIDIKQESTDEMASRNFLSIYQKNTQSPDGLMKTSGTSSTPKPSSDSYQNYRNNLSASACYLNQSDRASSIDNSSLSSTNTSFERQESKDSGYCNLNKNSFESMKSLSIG